MNDVIPHAFRHIDGRYLFTVNPNTYQFTWDHGVRMDGMPFLER